MTNKEKYGDEIIELATNAVVFGLKNGKPAICEEIKCEECDFYESDSCKGSAYNFREWLNSEYDWSKVPVDTPILVRDSELFAWSKEHFAKYEDETVYTWDYGKTSWSTYDGKMSSYKYAMLPESEDQNENKQD